MGDAWPEGATVGFCKEYTYRNISCRFAWNRGDAVKEAEVMYEMTPHEWSDSWLLKNASIEAAVGVLTNHDELFTWGRQGAALRVYDMEDRFSRSYWRVYPENGGFFYAITDDYGNLIQVP